MRYLLQVFVTWTLSEVATLLPTEYILTQIQEIGLLQWPDACEAVSQWSRCSHPILNRFNWHLPCSIPYLSWTRSYSTRFIFSASYSVHIHVSLTWLFPRWEEEYCPCPISHLSKFATIMATISMCIRHLVDHPPMDAVTNLTCIHHHIPTLTTTIYFTESCWLNTSYNCGSILSSDGEDCLQCVFEFHKRDKIYHRFRSRHYRTSTLSHGRWFYVLSWPSSATRTFFMDETVMFLRLKAYRMMTFEGDKRWSQAVGAEKKIELNNPRMS